MKNFPLWNVLHRHASRWLEGFEVQAQKPLDPAQTVLAGGGEAHYLIDLVHVDEETGAACARATVSFTAAEFRSPGFGKLFDRRMRAGVAALLAFYRHDFKKEMSLARQQVAA